MKSQGKKTAGKKTAKIAPLFTRRKQEREETQSYIRRLTALSEISHSITSSLDLRTILELLLEKIDSFLPHYAAINIRLLNRKTGKLEPVACRGINEEEWKAIMAKPRAGLPRLALQTKGPLIVSNAQIHPETLHPDFLRKHGLVSYLGIPLMAKGEDMGVLSVLTKEEHSFRDEEIKFLTTLAGQAAIAIHNSQLYDETKKQAEELAKANVDLERANKAKDDFLSVMSHELRTPLNVIIGYTGMIMDGMLGKMNPEQEGALRKVMERSGDLLRMISEILEATRIEAETVKVESDEVNLANFLDDLRLNYEARLNKHLKLNWDYPPESPVIRTDGRKLKHILQNLIDNALKFTDQGNVTVSARIKEGGRQQPTEALTHGSYLSSQVSGRAVEFKVADTGIGIKKEMLPSIFEMFRQVDTSDTRSYGGVGIGLFIVKKYTDLLGGTVNVESEIGIGSTFTVTIPCNKD